MAFLGMAPEEVQQLGQLLSNKIPGDIDTIISTVTAQLSSTQWVGPDRDQFEGSWTGEYTGQLNAVKAALQDFGARALTESQQQESASGVAG